MDPLEREYLLFRRKLLLVVGVILLLALAWFVRNILVLVFIAGILAGAIAPAVRRVQVFVRRYLRRRIPRGAAVLIVFIPFVGVLVTIGALTVPRLLSEGGDLAATLPLLIEQKLGMIPGIEAAEVESSVRKWVNELPLFQYLRNAVTAVVSMVAIIFMMAYMLIDGERLRNLFLLFFPAHERSYRRQTITRVGRRLSSWLGGQLTLAAIIGVASFVAFVALDIPYAIPLALIAAVGEMVPVIGPILGAVPALGVALFTSNWQFWGVLAATILIQQLENYLLVPRIMGRKVSVSPLAVFVAFMIGASLLGIIGALMAVPTVAIVQIIFEESFLAHRERRRDRERSGVLLAKDSKLGRKAE